MQRVNTIPAGRGVEHRSYRPEEIKTILDFHQSAETYRCIVGPVGSGKSSAAAWEICYYLPHYLKDEFGIKHTLWLVLRNTYDQLIDSTMKTLWYWFGWGTHQRQRKRYFLKLTDDYSDCTVEIWYRSCDNPKEVEKFGGYELTGYWID